MMSSSTSGSDPFSSAESKRSRSLRSPPSAILWSTCVPHAGRTNRQHDTGASSGRDERATKQVTRDVNKETADPDRLAWEMSIQETSNSHAGHGTHKAQLDNRRQNEPGQATRQLPGSPMSQPAARPVSDRLAGTTATRAGNDGWPPGNGRASRKRASHKAGKTAAHLATNSQAVLFHWVSICHLAAIAMIARLNLPEPPSCVVD